MLQDRNAKTKLSKTYDYLKFMKFKNISANIKFAKTTQAAKLTNLALGFN